MASVITPEISSSGALACKHSADKRSQSQSIWRCIRPDGWRIVFTYVLFNGENLLRIVEPMMLGWAVNDLLHSRYRGLLAFLAIRSLAIAAGAIRRAYDTRLFTRIYTRLVTSMVTRQLQNAVTKSQILARSRLSQEIVDFFEHYLPIVLQTGYKIVGAIMMLAWFDPLLVGLCLTILVPAWWISLKHGRRTQRLNAGYNDELERQADAIDSAMPDCINGHYHQLARWQVRVSDAVAVNFGAMGLLSVVLTAAILLYGCRLPSVQVGDVLAIVHYLGMFILGLEQIPMLVQQAGRLRDIARRISSRTPDGAESTET